MLKRVIQVNPDQDFIVHVYFSDGKIKLFNMKPYLNRGVFAQFSDLDNFLNKCTVMNGTLAWDLSEKYDPSNCVDIDHEVIYSTSISVTVDPLEVESA